MSEGEAATNSATGDEKTFLGKLIYHLAEMVSGDFVGFSDIIDRRPVGASQGSVHQNPQGII